MRIAAGILCVAIAAWGATLTDVRGKQVRIPNEVQRLVAIPAPMASVIIGLDGGPQRLVGIHPSSLQSIKEGFLGKMFPQAMKLRTDFLVGDSFNVNAESLLLLRPDAVVTWAEPAEGVASIERVHVPAVALTNNPANQDLHEQNLRIVGALLGKAKRAEEVIARHRRTLQNVKATLASVAKSPRPKVLYLRLAESSLAPSGAPSYQDFWINLAGGDNVARTIRGNSSTVSAEQIVAWNPDVIFVGSFDAATPATIMNNPRFAGLRAVRTKRVYKLPHGGYRWDPGSLESHLTWQWAAKLLYPGKFDFDVRSATREYYAFLYNYKVSDVELDQILQLRLNASQANYDFGKR
jgi:iron complex transport system substrate-binding protein